MKSVEFSFPKKTIKKDILDRLQRGTLYPLQDINGLYRRILKHITLEARKDFEQLLFLDEYRKKCGIETTTAEIPRFTCLKEEPFFDATEYLNRPISAYEISQTFLPGVGPASRPTRSVSRGRAGQRNASPLASRSLSPRRTALSHLRSPERVARHPHCAKDKLLEVIRDLHSTALEVLCRAEAQHRDRLHLMRCILSDLESHGELETGGLLFSSGSLDLANDLAIFQISFFHNHQRGTPSGRSRGSAQRPRREAAAPCGHAKAGRPVQALRPAQVPRAGPKARAQWTRRCEAAQDVE
eukprot:gnl/Trimastix_PCT/3814.p1 GENE.gnl/Trimastix_PCT/3814~~gnl/Trimastix_PCT/3814.p1  ORF type:complete len:311 (+),score=18.17 gnl/Trimastix_PCT/3814:41-934(+)